MLNYHYWYAAVWSAVVILYTLPLSRLNIPLPSELLFFFLITIAASILMGLVSNRRHETLEADGYTRQSAPGLPHRTLVTVLVFGFAADWAYQGSVPLLSGELYSGFDPTLDSQITVGLPVLHVAVVAISIAYALYLAYLYAVSRSRRILVIYLVLLTLFLFNQSRGSMVLALFTLALCMGFTTPASRPLRRGLTIGVSIVGLAIFIGIFGNLRVGMEWSDYSYIKLLGRYENPYVREPLDAFAWTYTYLTSPLSNLANNATNGSPGHSLIGGLLTFVPYTFSKNLLPGVPQAPLIVDSLNASTGFNPTFSQLGVLGLYLSYIYMALFFTLWHRAMRTQGHLVKLARSVSILFVVANVFYSPFANVALGFAPILIWVAAIIHRRASTPRMRATTRHQGFRQRPRPRTQIRGSMVIPQRRN